MNRVKILQEKLTMKINLTSIIERKLIFEHDIYFLTLRFNNRLNNSSLLIRNPSLLASFYMLFHSTFTKISPT